jgi:integration host factor subunit alpha
MSGSVTRFELCNAVHQKVGLSRAESTALVELVLKEIIDCLERGERVMLTSFGSFEVRKKEPRIGRHPVTGEKILITPRRVIRFKPSPILWRQLASRDRAQINQGVAGRKGEAPARYAPGLLSHRDERGGHAGGAAL